jgi:hypothetical protein
MLLKPFKVLNNIMKHMVRKATLSFDVGSKNLAYCLIDENENIRDWAVVDIGAATYDKQCQKLIVALDKIDYSCCYPEEEEQSIIVVIERQPSVNPRMRVISGQMQMYYALEKAGANGNVKIEKIVFYSPKFKLRCYKFREGDKPVIPKKYSTPYAFRKNLAIQHCDIIIHRKNKDGEYIQDKKWVEFFEEKGKSDDKSDSYLQSLAYMRGI